MTAPTDQSPTARPTPDEAWTTLQEGNRRFVEGAVGHPHQDAAWRASLADQQHPRAIIFGCSDSRLAAEIIFDVGLGDMFVIRTAGQVIDDAVLGTLEYGVDVLEIPLIVVLGHDSCGAVTAAVEYYASGQMPPGYLRTLVERITPSVITAQHGGVTDVNGTVSEHVTQTAAQLLEASRSVAEAVEAGRTAVVGVTYSLADGTTHAVQTIGQLSAPDLA